MPDERRILRSRRVLLPEGAAAADVVVEGERIAGVEPPRGPLAAADLDLGDLVLMAGLVDAHVHVNEPGRTEWEGFAHATRAAAAGGTTTIADMPLNSEPVTTSTMALAAKRAAALGQCWVDVGFHGGIVPSNAGRAETLEALASDGVLAFKAFLCDSGIPEFPPVGGDELAAAMPVLARTGTGLLAHAEIAPAIAAGAASRIESYRAWEASRPEEYECRAIELLIALCRSTSCAVHVVHLAAAAALPMLRDARAAGLPVTIETCPHYLRFAADELPDGDPRFKCAPPIRGRENREALWQALLDGTIDLIASDHSPCPPDMKTRGHGDLGAAWGGIASLQLTLPVVWSGARERGPAPERLARWLCARPAELLGLASDRGTIEPGRLASLVAWDPEADFVVDAERLLHRHPLTPYAGERLWGVVERTWVRGLEAARQGTIVGRPIGQLLRRRASRGAGAEAAAPAASSHFLAAPRHDDAALRQVLTALRQKPRRELEVALERCCASRAWIAAMMEVIGSTQPERQAAGDGEEELCHLADACFERLTREDWLEAFAGHPRIGDLESLRRRFASTVDLAAHEQAGTRAASDRVLAELAQGNAEYERRFGHLFIVCATGKSADEMLHLLRQRMDNDPAVELAIAAGEQRMITRLRLLGTLRGADRP